MVKVRFNTTVKYEVDTETGATRILSKWTTPMGEGSWDKKKKKPKNQVELVSEEISEEYM